jgi:Ca2+-transporting ATPase
MTAVHEPLSAEEASARLKAHGPNSLPRSERRSLLSSAWQVLREPMFLLLLASGVVYLALGEVRDALVLMVFATASTMIALVQDQRSERVLEKLRDLGAPMAWVLRREGRRQIPASEVVPGDLMLLSEGDRVAADAVLIESHEVETDESLLTGESEPVAKSAAAGDGPETSAAASLFAGALVVRGHGLAQVTATGPATRMGELGAALKTIATQPSDLVRQSRKLVGAMGVAALCVCLLIVLVYGVGRGAWLTGVLGGLAVGMSLIPEEVPLVMTVYAVMGAWRIAKAGVLARNTSAIEALGAATVLCTDKTGTLTLNRMTVARGWAEGMSLDTEDPRLTDLARLAALATAADTVEPMERAILARAGAPAAGTVVGRFGVSPQFLATAQVWAAAAPGGLLQAAAKGAPETIADLCALGCEARAAMLAAAEAMGRDGIRVLGLASGTWPGPAPPAAPRDVAFRLVGLIGLADPIRAEAPAAVKACQGAGIRVIMITGDHPATARAIAAQAGLPTDRLLSGADLEPMTDADLAAASRETSVFARILPVQKLRLIRALQAGGEVVAMTGDGVNDAPALKAADIGIAMGARGSDVAREAASLVLIKDGFGAIADTVRLGRRVFANLRQALSFILAVHIPIAGLALVPPLLGGQLVLLPLHIALLEVFIDPMCSIAFEAEPAAPDLMTRPPRSKAAPLFPRTQMVQALVLGFVGLAVVLAVFLASRAMGEPATASRAAAFAALVLVDIAVVFGVRVSFNGIGSVRQPNASMWGLVSGAFALLAVGLFTPFGRTLLEVTPPAPQVLALAVGLCPLVILAAWVANRWARAKAVSLDSPAVPVHPPAGTIKKRP